MIYFLDTSVLAKRYLSEPGSDSVRVLFRRRRRVAVSRLAYAELAAAVARAWREKLVDEDTRDSILARLDRDFAALDVVEARAPIVRRVPRLVVEWPLRGYDAVHLCSALAVRDAGGAVDFWAADGPLIDAARGLGLRATAIG